MAVDDLAAPVTVRPARVEDAAVLHRISVAAIHGSAAGHYDQQQRDAWAGRRSEEGHRRLVEETRTLVAMVGDSVAGFVSVALQPTGQLRAGEVDQLFVDPGHGGRGIARRLLAAVDEVARAAGLPQPEAHASWRAAAVFERSGDARGEVETVDVQGVTLTRVAMHRDLGRGQG